MTTRPAFPRPRAHRPAAAALLVAASVVLAGGLVPPASSAAAARGPEHLQPKAATGVDRFLAEHPAHDGRGVTVAIFDTGVDPGAPGLQVTSDGRPKVVDLIDGSGSGDVDTSTVLEAEDGALEGLSGRTLILDPDWANPTGEWRVGLKPAAELWPRGLAGRMRSEIARERDAEGRRILEELRRRHAEAEDAKDEDAAKDLERLIAAAERAHERGPGEPVHDVVVFHDGEHWRAVVDTDEDGDLRDERAMASFRHFREWSSFGDEARLNFSVNVYREGDLLSIVTDCGAHGTHVAGMVAAHFPGEEHLDGIAPGARIVSVKIGDHRLGSSSTGTGEMRGMIALLEHGVDIVNMSYGGPSGFPDDGLQVDLLSELVNRHGVLFVASAGNDGPALSTVGSPGGTSSALIGVGAAIDPGMMEQLYSVREPHEELAYTWSSRGPVADGALGVDITAPGGAIAPVPNWQLRRATLMNGTSMSAPSTAGGLALLVSALKAGDMEVDPHAIKRAITRTARRLDTTSVFGQGAGMLQVDAAWEWLREHADAPDAGVRYEVSVDGGRGIHLREPHETDGPHVTRVRLSPVMHEDEDHQRRVDFAMDLELEASERWVDVAPTLHLLHGGRSFEVRVDPTDLDPGVHFATVDVHDARGRDRGPVVRIPVTVIRGESVDAEPGEDPRMERTLEFGPGAITRTFVDVPAEATWADVELRRTDEADESRRYWIQSMQLREDRSFTSHHLDTRATIDAADRWQGSVAVVPGSTMELAIAQFWSSLGESELEMTVTFRGLVPETRPIVLDGARRLTPVDVHARLGDHPIAPSGSFTRVRRTLPAMSSDVRPMSPVRDRLPDDRLAHELVTKHRLVLEDDARVSVLPATRFMDGVNEELFSQIVHVHEADTGRRVISRSAWDDDPIPMDAGTYELHVHQVAVDRSVLEDAADLPIQVDLRLGSPIRVRVSGDPAGPGRGSGGSASTRLEGGSSTRVYLGLPALDDWPKAARPGDLLVGTIGFGDAGGVPGGSGRRPGGWDLMATVPARTVAAAPSGSGGGGGSGGATGGDAMSAEDADAALEESIRDARIASLHHRAGADLDRHASELLEAHPDHRPLRRAILERRAALAADHDDGVEAVAAWEAVLAAAEDLAATIDRRELAAAIAIPPAEDEQAAGEEAEPLDVAGTRADLVLALEHEAIARLHLAQLADAEPGSEEADAVDAAIDRLERWAASSDAVDHELRLGVARLQGRHGAALELVHEAVEREPRGRAHHETRIELLRELGWDRWAHEAERELAVRFPASTIVY